MTRARILFLSLFLATPLLLSLTAAERSGPTMQTAATKLLASLTAEQKQKATFAFESSEREHWGFVPTEMFPRNGLTIKEMTEPQRKLAHDLVKVGLSQRGYLTVTTIMNLENILKVIEPNFVRDEERYFFSVFGTPSDKGAWGWRAEGHHISVNFTIINGAVMASAPAFFGSNPAEVRSGPLTGTRILGPQEDAGRALLNALDASLKQKAIFNQVALNDIVTMNQPTIGPLATAGVSASELSASQRAMLKQVIESYTSLMASDIAADRMSRLEKAGFDKITFAWAGETELGKKHYYRVQGPTFLIEYDNTQSNGNHVHSVWRDFAGDFGRDLLREHLRSAH